MFTVLFTILVIQRITELFIAKRNEKWMMAKGGVKHGEKHYPLIVVVHTLFLISLITEVTVFHKGLSSLWSFILPFLLLTQIIRYWAVMSLGPYWNTKIIILPDSEVVAKGPYRFMRHPNYVVVALEILFIPLLFNAYITAVLFTISNIFLMIIRIPEEEKALQLHTDYKNTFEEKYRFFPKKLN
ncbi:isoprenylcysteine carboxyl methyltransferase family protein [Metabacillus fastidiosus]|uniref:isoprenylcysteine carboxyl methyltransferase family protein n=1 Tax=Metabacillus fastidiosus TaxID=1458 RepID=UPI003D283C5B